MKTFLVSLKVSIISLFLMTLLLGLVYPFFMWGIGQIVFHKKTNGTLFVYKDGEVIGSEWIGQNFSLAKYFQPRPSSAGTNGYDASNSSGSNLGPTSASLISAIKGRVAAYRSANSLSSNILVPADAVTGSGSGLDPHITLANAYLQAPRVASARSIPLEEVNELIGKYKEGRTLGLFGERRVNVLRLNLALDQVTLEGE